MFFVTGQSDYFGFGFTILHSNETNETNENFIKCVPNLYKLWYFTIKLTAGFFIGVPFRK